MLVLFLVFASLAQAQKPARFKSWKPKFYRECEVLSSTDATQPFLGGISCGSSSYYIMSGMYPTKIASTSTLGLINVGWITTAALRDEDKFWKACKRYMTRIFDGLYSNAVNACFLTVNPPAKVPVCTTTKDLIYRSGSGYCMTKRICGASVPIKFYGMTGSNDTLIYSWEAANDAQLEARGLVELGKCYGYKLTPNPSKTDVTITTPN
ncbi:unnamed protein product [Caenorhabditis bovis]|uniref:Uncharacterized protein n=1 Tax=Caenorhabditis bovis TaxID=2654633 RepID=A0A8S1FFZ1_9PELO|nr:unnamed protein product [Caenorhabditis bovis]